MGGGEGNSSMQRRHIASYYRIRRLPVLGEVSAVGRERSC